MPPVPALTNVMSSWMRPVKLLFGLTTSTAWRPLSLLMIDPPRVTCPPAALWVYRAATNCEPPLRSSTPVPLICRLLFGSRVLEARLMSRSVPLLTEVVPV